MKQTISLLSLMLVSFYFYGQVRSQTDFRKIPARHLSEILSLNNMNLEAERVVDNKQKLDSIVAYNSLGSSFAKNIFTYDDEEHVIQEIFMMGSINTREKTEYVYDANGLLISSILYNYIALMNEWEEEEKTDFTYNESGKLILQLFYEWDNDSEQWAYSSKTEYIYNPGDKLILRIESEWLNEWVEDWKSEYTYDLNGNLIEQIDYDYWNSFWVKTWKHEYQYDPDEKLILEFDYEWESSGMQWLPVYRYEYTWDNQDNLIYDITYEWEASGSKWNNKEKNEYQYDTNYSYPEFILPLTYDEFPWIFSKMVTEQTYFSWNASSGTWELFFSALFYYSDYIPGYIYEPEPLHFQLHPNPAKGNINISVEGFIIDEVIIYALTGQQIMKTGAEGNNIDISGIPAGVYIVEALVEGRKVRQRLVIQR